MKKGLTPQQERVFLFIVRAIQDGLPPTLREISTFIPAKSSNAAADVVRKLEAQGLVDKRSANTSRNLRLTERGRAYAKYLERREQLATRSVPE